MNIWVEAKICTKFPIVSALFEGAISYNFLPPPNFYEFSYKNGLYTHTKADTGLSYYFCLVSNLEQQH